MKLTQKSSTVPPRVATLAEEIARGQLRVLWPQVMRETARHLKDEPGFHLDEGTYAKQLRFHDSEGVLRGILVRYHEAEDTEKKAEYEWDHHGDDDQQPGRISVVVDPESPVSWQAGVRPGFLNWVLRLAAPLAVRSGNVA